MSDQPQYLYALSLPNGEELEVWRLPHGGVVGVDSSFLDQVQDTIQDPYNAFNGEENQYRLLEPVGSDGPELLTARPTLFGAPPPGIAEFVELQACDGSVWVNAETILEAHLQQELRKLHSVVEGVLLLLRDNTHDNSLEEHLEKFGSLSCLNGTPPCWNCIEDALLAYNDRGGA